MIINIDMRETGQRITELRKEKLLSSMELAEEMHVTPQAVYHWEYGRSMPSIDNLLHLARFFEVSMEEIIVYKGE